MELQPLCLVNLQNILINLNLKQNEKENFYNIENNN